jgi:two-component system, OmpR family, response regulator VanR
MRVLVVDDEEDLADAVRTALRRAAIAADVAYDGDAALAQLAVNDYDAVVLDRDLPGMSGDEVCRAIAGQRLPTRVLMLTAARRLDQKVAGFELGADDYLTKPFELPELIARLRALARRPSEGAPPVLTAGDVDLDPFRVEVLRAGRRVPVTRKEFAVLHVLMSARGGTVSAEQLLEKAWDENADPFTNAIRVTISSLRKKLGTPPPCRGRGEAGGSLAGSAGESPEPIDVRTDAGDSRGAQPARRLRTARQDHVPSVIPAGGAIKDGAGMRQLAEIAVLPTRQAA